MTYGRNCVVLHWMFEATRAGDLQWSQNEDGWYITQLADRTICFRTQMIEITDPVRPEEYLIDLHMPGLSTGFGCGSDGWYILREIIRLIEPQPPAESPDLLAFLNDHLPPVDPALEANIVNHYRAEQLLIDRLSGRIEDWLDGHEHGWYERELGGETMMMRFRYFESLREVGARPRMVELDIPGWNAGFFCGTYGFAHGWHMFSASRDETIVPVESIEDFFRNNSLDRPHYEPPPAMWQDLRILDRLLYATIHRHIEWTEQESDSLWHTCQVGGQTIELRSYWIASMNQIGADPYLIDFSFGDHHIRFTPGTEGFSLAMHIRYEMDPTGRHRQCFDQAQEFVLEHVPPIELADESEQD